MNLRKMSSGAGVVGGLLMTASGLLHSVIGWRELNRALAGTNVPLDVTSGLAVPWQFAGASMMLFGLLAVWSLVTRPNSGRGELVLTVGGLYVLFAAWAALAVKPDPFLLIFLVPGLMVTGAGLEMTFASTTVATPR